MPTLIGEIKRLIGEVYPQIRDLRRDLHRHPEVAFGETRTAATVVEHMKRLKIPCRAKVGRTGVVALLKGARPGPCIALRADMDALPIQEESRLAWRSVNKGAMHACGHDGHTANLVGVAHVLAQMKPRIAGSVKFIFQPAEEAGEQGGAELMVDDGALQSPKPAMILALHSSSLYPIGTIAIRPGPVLAAADFFDIRIFGKGSHAGHPHRGIDSVVIAASIIEALQTVVSRSVNAVHPAVVTVGMVDGGTARNIIPPTVLLGGTCRSYEPKVTRLLERLIKRIPKEVARALGGRAEVNFMKCYPVTSNSRSTADFLAAAAAEALGKTRVVECDPIMGGEDFSFYRKRIPGAFFWLGIGHRGMQPHTPTYEFDDRALVPGMLVLSAAVMKKLGT